jgi:hypothetical protein
VRLFHPDHTEQSFSELPGGYLLIRRNSGKTE